MTGDGRLHFAVLGSFRVSRDGQEVDLGLVNWRRQPITVPSSYCWEIGIVLLPEARGRGYGTHAQRLLARYLFAHTTVHRIWAGTEVGDLPEQRARAKAGFTREGITRVFTLAVGAHDTRVASASFQRRFSPIAVAETMQSLAADGFVLRAISRSPWGTHGQSG